MIYGHWADKAGGLVALGGSYAPGAQKAAQSPAQWQAEQLAIRNEYEERLLGRRLDVLQAQIEHIARRLGVRL